MNINLDEVRPTTFQIKGLRYASNWDINIIKSGLSYKAKDDDIFISSYPKSGTNWLAFIVYLILHDGVPPDDYYTIWKLCPCLELNGSDFVENRIKPGVIWTHLPFHLQPYNPKAKYIFILRNPKDVIVSLYYHIICKPDYHYKEDFHHFFKLWLEGVFVYEDYFEFIKSWWRHRTQSNFLFLFYEDLKRNPKKEIKKLAKFIDEEHVQKLKAKNEMLLNKILMYSSFDYMKNEQKGLSERYIRKGIVGDWRTHFNEEESIIIDRLVAEKWNGTHLDLHWSEELKWDSDT